MKWHHINTIKYLCTNLIINNITNKQKGKVYQFIQIAF